MLSPVTLNGRYLQNANGRFIPIGVNWVPATSAMQWPFEWNPQAIAQDFAQMRALGINLVRLDLLWQWVEPRPGQYNPQAFAQFDYFIELAHHHHIYLNPALFAGGEVGDAWWEVPWRHGRHPHADSDMLYWQARHVEEWGRRYRGESAILAWDLTDEPPYWVVMHGQTSDAMAAVWTQLLATSLRHTDPEHLIMVGASNMELSRGPFRADIIAPWCDFLSIHPYPLYNQSYYPEPILSTRSSFAPTFETLLAQSVGKPVMMQEFGSTSAQCGLETQARYYNVFMHAALAAGNIGLVAWTYSDAAPNTQYQRAPYKRNPHETQFGITDYQGNTRPNGRELQQMSQILSQLNLDGIEPEPPQAGILAPHEWAHGLDYREYGFPPDTLYQYVPRDDILHHTTDAPAQEQLTQAWLSALILARQAALPVAFPRENDAWTALPLILAPYPLTGSSGVYFSYHLYTTFWQKAAGYVANGGVLYASLNANAAIPHELCAELTGVTLEDRARWHPEITITFSRAWGQIPAGFTLQLPAFAGVDGTGVILTPTTAEVLAVDQHGNPAITLHPYGKGWCVLAAYPLELLLGKMYFAFEQPRPEVALYAALRRLAGIAPAYQAAQPEVVCSCLSGPRHDYVLAVNHSGAAQTGEVTATAVPLTVAQVTPSGKQPVVATNGHWPFALAPFQGAIYEVIHRQSA